MLIPFVFLQIADLDGEDSLNLTTTTLRRCKQQVLRPYWRLLMLVSISFILLMSKQVRPVGFQLDILE